MGHPIHPSLVAFPIGFFVGALVSDIISRWGDPAFWPRMSVVLIGFGIVSALVAAVFGFVDLFTAPMPNEARTTGYTHMTLNLIMVVVFIAAFFVRMTNATSVTGYVLTVIGVLIMLGAANLGGHLAYHFKVGVEEPSPGSKPNPVGR